MPNLLPYLQYLPTYILTYQGIREAMWTQICNTVCNIRYRNGTVKVVRHTYLDRYEYRYGMHVLRTGTGTGWDSSYGILSVLTITTTTQNFTPMLPGYRTVPTYLTSLPSIFEYRYLYLPYGIINTIQIHKKDLK